MRRTLTGLVLFSAALLILQSLPGHDQVVVSQTGAHGAMAAEWVQTKASDFERGQLDCVVITAADDGEVALAQQQDGEYCGVGTLTSQVYQAPVFFNVIGAAWSAEKPMGTSFQLEVRASRDRHTWTDWLEVFPDEDGPGIEEMTYGNLLEVSAARYLQYRLTLSTFETGVSPVVDEIVITVMDTREGPTTEEARAMILPQEVTSGVPQPRIISRKGWGANESWETREPTYRKPVAIVIHHTVTPNDAQDAAAIVRAILRYHAISRGWGAIGYNYLIDREGNIYEGRKGGPGVVGVHAAKYNYGSVGIALLGDYRSAQVTPAMKQALVSLLAWEADRFGIHPLESSYFIDRRLPHIVGHRDLLPTICPGDKVYRLLPELRQLTWQRLLDHNPRVTIDTPEAGEAVAGKVEVQVSSPSPTTASVQLFLDGTMQVEGESPVRWIWNTPQFNEGRHRLRAVATSIEGRTSRVVHEVVVDNTPPEGSVLINEGAAYTSELTVTLSLEAEDEQGEVTGMQFTHEDATEFSEVESLASSREWVLTAGDGKKTVGVRFLDRAGNTSPVASATILLDTEAPGDWSLVEGGESGRFVVRVSDQGSGLDESSAACSVSTDQGITWGEWRPVSCQDQETEGSLPSCRLLAESADGAVRFRVKDMVGNEGLSPVYRQTTSPTPQETPSPTAEPTRRPTMTPTVEIPASTLPDLVVKRIVITPETSLESVPLTVTVVIENDASVDTASGFWVQLFVDPPAVPGMNSISVQDGEGALWYIPGLGAQEVLSLALEEADSRYSNFGGRLSEGRHEVFAYVDAYNPEGEVGLVSEVDETNNMLGPLVVEIGREADGYDGGSTKSVPREILDLFLQRLVRLLAQLRQHVGSRRG